MHVPGTVTLHRLARASMLTVLVAVASGCTPAGPDLSIASVDRRMAPDLTRDETSAVIAVTQLLNVQLPMQAGTGYAWELAQPLGEKAAVGFADSSSQSIGASETMVVGGSLLYTVSLVGVRPGQERVTFVYRRPWEAADAIAKTYIIDVTVTPAPDA